jgi:hypothetical protein
MRYEGAPTEAFPAVHAIVRRYRSTRPGRDPVYLAFEIAHDNVLCTEVSFESACRACRAQYHQRGPNRVLPTHD